MLFVSAAQFASILRTRVAELHAAAGVAGTAAAEAAADNAADAGNYEFTEEEEDEWADSLFENAEAAAAFYEAEAAALARYPNTGSRSAALSGARYAAAEAAADDAADADDYASEEEGEDKWEGTPSESAEAAAAFYEAEAAALARFPNSGSRSAAFSGARDAASFSAAWDAAAEAAAHDEAEADAHEYTEEEEDEWDGTP
jgi:hypothetical protein